MDHRPPPPAGTSSGNGLVFFRPGTDAGYRRRRLVFLAVYLAGGAMVLWPVYPLFAGASPLILGLPLSFAWVVLALLVQLAALLWLFRSELRSEPPEES